MFYKIDVFIPKEYVKKLVDELNSENMLTIGNYDYCYSTLPVQGHFRPNESANNFSGEVGKLNTVEEVKLEFRVRDKDIKKCISIIEDIHPYEECVYDIFEIKNFK